MNDNDISIYFPLPATIKQEKQPSKAIHLRSIRRTTQALQGHTPLDYIFFYYFLPTLPSISQETIISGHNVAGRKKP